MTKPCRVAPTHISNIIASYQALAIKVQLAAGNVAILPRAAFTYRMKSVAGNTKHIRAIHIYWFCKLMSINLYQFHDEQEFRDHYRRRYNHVL